MERAQLYWRLVEPQDCVEHLEKYKLLVRYCIISEPYHWMKIRSRYFGENFSWGGGSSFTTVVL